MDTFLDIVRYLLEAPATSHLTCYALHFNGKALDHGLAVGAVEGLTSPAELQLVERTLALEVGGIDRRSLMVPSFPFSPPA